VVVLIGEFYCICVTLESILFLELTVIYLKEHFSLPAFLPACYENTALFLL